MLVSDSLPAAADHRSRGGLPDGPQTDSMTDLFRRAESTETAVQVSVASGFRVFLSGVRGLSMTARLLERGSRNADDQRKIADRIATLVEQQIDLRYLHPHDIPLAIYLYVLHRLDGRRPGDEGLSRLAATTVLGAPNCGWARTMARGVLADAGHHADTTSVVVPSSPDAPTGATA